MKRLFIAGVFAVIAAISFAADDVKVRGYQKKDGTTVEPHYRTAPDARKDNNWSSKPNINPRTGKEGTKDPNAPSSPRTNPPKR